MKSQDLVDVLELSDDELKGVTGGLAAVQTVSSNRLQLRSFTRVSAGTTLPGGGSGDPTAASFEYSDELEDGAVSVL